MNVANFTFNFKPYLQAISKVPDSASVTVLMRYNDNLVPSDQQTAGELVDVTLHPSHVGVEKVTHHAATQTFLYFIKH